MLLEQLERLQKSVLWRPCQGGAHTARAQGAARGARLLRAPSRQPPSCAVPERYSLQRSASWQSYSVKLMPATWLQHWDEGAFILPQYLPSQMPPLRLASRTTWRQPQGVPPCVGLKRWEMPGDRDGSRALPVQQTVLFSSRMGTLIPFTYRYVPHFPKAQIKQKKPPNSSIKSHLTDTTGGFWPMQKAKICFTSVKWVNSFSSAAEKCRKHANFKPPFGVKYL